MHRILFRGVIVSLVMLALANAPAVAQRVAPVADEPPLIDVSEELRALDELAAYFEDANVEAAQYLQPPALSVPPEGSSAESPRTVRRSSRSEYVRLARVPNMLGDSLGTGGQFGVESSVLGRVVADMPIGAGRSVKVGENNKGLPMDRVYFIYNGFQNALSVRSPGRPTRDIDVDRYTLGGEKTFFGGLTSLDVRMPFIGGIGGGNGGQSGGLSSQNIGDLSMLFKSLLYADDSLALGGGLCMTLPTASDVQFFVPPNNIRLKNEAVHLLPYIGIVTSFTDDWFFQTYLQFDFAASGFKVQNPGATNTPVLTEQNFMYVDATLGRWLYVNDCARYLQGIAGLVELHYTTTLQDADIVTISGQGFVGTLGNEANRVDFLNMTAGLQFQIGQLSNLRVCGVVPLKSKPFDRQFDSEVLVSFNRFF